MAQARTLSRKGQPGGLTPKQPTDCAWMIDPTCDMVRLGTTTGASQALNAAALTHPAHRP